MTNKNKEEGGGKSGRFWSTPLIVAWIGIGLLISIILAGMIVGTLDVKPTKEKTPVVQEDIERPLLERLGAHIAIPEDEEPTIATVEDPEAMRQNNPSFYKRANEGDLLIVWSSMAVLYSPEKDLILAVLPLSVGASEAKKMLEEPSEEPVMEENALEIEQETVQIEVLNGTRTPGLAGKVTKLIENQGFSTLKARDARTKGYEKTLIIKESEDELPETIKVLSELLDAEIAERPAAETTVNGDIVIILGSNYVSE